ncbi:hypothetical protein [Alicyclobacillus sp. ALC3]|uniref:hypothetical protein n=1 Tax=Alicyclobacillus sp. ALC3 TaxID=2796143 RepID=UPI0023780C10|nr:hypothetical protein [Alicyclobacillus sp. ALC3]WDL98131.1 hypothetical protein JC200_05365 [Alicyclobacillus sp. ALC3]
MRQPQQRAYMQLASDAFDVAVPMAFVGRFHVDGADAPAADTTSILALTALTAAAQTLTTGITWPAVSRNVQVVGSAAGIAGNVTVKGTGFDGKAISETLALNGTTTVVGNVAFRTITEIDLPAYTNGATDEISVGVGDKLGVPFKLGVYEVLSAWLGGVKEGTAPTVATDVANMENNTITLNSALDGNDVDVFIVL